MSNSYTTLTTAAFLNGLGANTHIPYTDGEYNNTALIVADLQYLGLGNIRDGISDGAWGSAPLSHYITLAQQGISFTFMVGNWITDNAGIAAVLSEIDQVERAVPGSVQAIEGPNEINNEPVTFNAMGGLQGALALQAALYADVKADPLLSGIPVDYFTGYAAGTVGVGPDLSTTTGLADVDTQHPYPNNNEAPAYWVSRAAALPNLSAPGPAVYTETGYSSNNVSGYVQEVYTLDLLMDSAQQGISQTYLYDLLDAYAPGSPQGDDGYGLFDFTGAPKPVAIGIHNLTAILRQGAAASAGTLATAPSFSLSGLPADGNSLVLQQPGGAEMIALWAEPALWDNTTNTQRTAPREEVTISLGATAGEIALFDPVAGTQALAIATAASSLTVTLTDHPLLVEIVPATAAPQGVVDYALCFALGTLILTPAGEVPVERLREGGLVVTPSGPRRIKWLGRRGYTGADIAGNHLMLPVCLRRDALADGVPRRDLWVSPGHGIFIGAALIPAWRLINGVTIVQPAQLERVDYIHVELESHELLLAENCPAESYYDIGSRAAFHNAESYHARHGHAAPAGPPLPRLEEGFALRDIIHRLRRRAGLGGPPAAPGPLRGYIDLAGPHRAAGWVQDETAPEEPVLLDVLVDGAPVAQVLANIYRPDVRAAGLGSGAHGFDLTLPRPGRAEIRRAADGASPPYAAGALAQMAAAGLGLPA